MANFFYPPKTSDAPPADSGSGGIVCKFADDSPLGGNLGGNGVLTHVNLGPIPAGKYNAQAFLFADSDYQNADFSLHIAEAIDFSRTKRIQYKRGPYGINEMSLSTINGWNESIFAVLGSDRLGNGDGLFVFHGAFEATGGEDFLIQTAISSMSYPAIIRAGSIITLTPLSQ